MYNTYSIRTIVANSNLLFAGNNNNNQAKGWLGMKYGTVYYPNITDNYRIVLDSPTNVAIASLGDRSQHINAGNCIVSYLWPLPFPRNLYYQFLYVDCLWP